MPDADDFDVEYFRNLLKGNSPQEAPALPAPPPPAGAKKSARRTGKAPDSQAKGTPAVGRKKPLPGAKSDRNRRAPGR